MSCPSSRAGAEGHRPEGQKGGLMAAINATYTFTPNAGGSVIVTGNTETEVKEAVKAQLAARLATQQAATDALNAAAAKMDQ